MPQEDDRWLVLCFSCSSTASWPGFELAFKTVAGYAKRKTRETIVLQYTAARIGFVGQSSQ